MCSVCVLEAARLLSVTAKTHLSLPRPAHTSKHAQARTSRRAGRWQCPAACGRRSGPRGAWPWWLPVGWGAGVGVCGGLRPPACIPLFHPSTKEEPTCRRSAKPSKPDIPAAPPDRPRWSNVFRACRPHVWTDFALGPPGSQPQGTAQHPSSSSKNHHAPLAVAPPPPTVGYDGGMGRPLGCPPSIDSSPPWVDAARIQPISGPHVSL